MPWSFWASYLLKLGIVGALLAALYAAVRALRRTRFFARAADRRIRVLETAVLSQHAAIYLLGVGERYFLVGAAGATIATLAELAPSEISAGRDYTLK
ncbi:MAG TPA: flagellar biosynthetic protein FliO [Candidatus Cybelea sp.]